VLLSANPETFEEAYGKMTGIEAVLERIGIAEKMLDADIAPEQIMTLTQLTLAQIDELRTEPIQ
jgi:hypothetical protein